MDLTNRGKVFLLIAILSFAFSYLLITLNFFPSFGVALTFIAFILLAYRFKKEKDKDTKLFFVLSLVFSILILVRSEAFTTFLNLSAALLFGLLMCLPGIKNNFSFLDHAFASASFIIRSLFSGKSDYFLEFKGDRKKFDPAKTGEVIFNVLATVILVAMVLPLLSSANPFFRNIVENILKYFDIRSLLECIGYQNVFVWLLRILFFFIFIFLIPKVLTLINGKGDNLFPFSLKSERFPLIIPKVVLALIILVFIITQLQFYFASDATLSSMGISHSQRTREVFAQLSVVAGIILVLVYNSKNWELLGKITNWILGIQGIFLTLMAYKSVFEYIDAWGLTYKRLYGLTFATWIAGIFILYFYYYKKRHTVSWFVRKTVIFSAGLLILVNVSNFDYLIFHFAKAQTGQGVDYTYLSTLSPDALSYKDQYLKLEENSHAGVFPVAGYDNKNPLLILYRIEALQKKYERFDIRLFNLLDFLQYREIRSIDTTYLMSYYKNILNTPNPPR
jgi:hypothetical protein